jgi:hypothetical protein
MEGLYVTTFLTFIWIKEGLYRRTVVTEDALAAREQNEQNEMQLAAEDPHEMICDYSLELVVYKAQTTCNHSVSIRPLQIEEKEGVSIRPLQIEEKEVYQSGPCKLKQKKMYQSGPCKLKRKKMYQSGPCRLKRKKKYQSGSCRSKRKKMIHSKCSK